MESSINFKSIMETVHCSVHQRSPKVTMDEYGRIALECCCIEFKIQCLYIIKKILADRMKQVGITIENKG
jgi:hypothetical protein